MSYVSTYFIGIIVYYSYAIAGCTREKKKGKDLFEAEGSIVTHEKRAYVANNFFPDHGDNACLIILSAFFLLTITSLGVLFGP